MALTSSVIFALIALPIGAEVSPLSLGSGGVDTLFMSDVHVGDQHNTWGTVEAAFAKFRQDHPSAPYLVYTGDTIEHHSKTEDDKADQYISTFIALAEKHGFEKANMFLAQGNNDGPHDKPLSPKWASAVANSGVVPAAEQETCRSGSYYYKCASGGVCGMILNTDLEVYGSGNEEAEDKAHFNSSLSDEDMHVILKAKKDQQEWASAKAKAAGSFFMLGHHPQLKHFFPKGASGFQGGVAGHIHKFVATDKHGLTLLPGYTEEAHTQGYCQGSAKGKLKLTSKNLVHFHGGDAGRRRRRRRRSRRKRSRHVRKR
jgi:predicted phosphodiesterase